jgi:hypothetical protein
MSILLALPGQQVSINPLSILGPPVDLDERIIPFNEKDRRL